uniref:BTB/POZ domain-containing protein n=1 Tax=Latimeria chalumnae TaxID=7897 RepID=H3AQ62_LATCH
SKSSTLSGPELEGKSSSETSTPEELKDYDSSSGGVMPASPPPIADQARIHPIDWVFFPPPPKKKNSCDHGKQPPPPFLWPLGHSPLSTIYEVEVAEMPDRLEKEKVFQDGLGQQEKKDVMGGMDVRGPRADLVQQLINQSLRFSREESLFHSKGSLNEVELSKWSELISPLDESRASITSVTSFSPEDITSPQGDWTVVELETFH